MFILYMEEMGGGCWHVLPCDHLVIKATFFGLAGHFLTLEPNLLCATYFTLLDTTFDIDMSCTWFLSRDCSCHHS